MTKREISPQHIYEFVSKFEGGYNNCDSRDPGGCTNRGVTYGLWSGLAPELFNKPGTIETLKQLTEQEFRGVVNYVWDEATWGNAIESQCVAEILFELNWAAGQGGLYWAQRAVNEYNKIRGWENIEVDGVVGKETAGALNRIIDEDECNFCLSILHCNQVDMFRNSRAANYYLNGWLRRSLAMRKRHIEMMMRERGLK